jgi:hypothetical protein
MDGAATGSIMVCPWRLGLLVRGSGDPVRLLGKA